MKTDMPRSRKDIRCKDIGIKGVTPPQNGKIAHAADRVICPALGDRRPGSGSSTAPSPAGPSARRARKKHDDQLLDETLEESFPASDPPSSGHIT